MLTTGWLLVSKWTNTKPIVDKVCDKIVGMHLFDAYVERMDDCSPSLACILQTPPTQIRENVYLGTSWDAASWEVLEKYNIKSVVNCAEEIRCYFKDDLPYLHLPLRDNNECTLSQSLVSSVIDFLDNQSENGGVLIHCYAGCSRSVAIITIWLVKRYAMSYESAYASIQNQRLNVNMSLQLMREVKRHANNGHTY